MNFFPIKPITKTIRGEINVLGSKSVTNRALILSALSTSRVELRNVSICEDTLAMANALESLGFAIKVYPEEARIIIQGSGGVIPKNNATINVNNAGTVARFVTALVCLKQNGSYYLDGNHQMRSRPMQQLIEALMNSQAISDIIYHETPGHLPFTLKTNGLRGGDMKINTDISSQFLSAILMIAPLGQSPAHIELEGAMVSRPYVSLTLEIMKEFGQDSLQIKDNKHIFLKPKPYSYSKKAYYIEPDLSTISYFLALCSIVGGRISFPGLSKTPKQGDAAFAEVIEKSGLRIDKHDDHWEVFSDAAKRDQLLSINFKDISDTFLTLAAISPLSNAETHIYGIEHTRNKECDRVGSIVRELRNMGQGVVENIDSITIAPKPLQSCKVQTHNDHRMAMSFAILGCYDLYRNGQPWLYIANPECCSKSCPNFFNILDELRK